MSRSARQGGNTATVYTSPKRAKARAAARAAQERRWAAKAGEVTTRQVGDERAADAELGHAPATTDARRA